MIYFAHRGACAKQVQNTLPSFALARQEGAVCYELDVHLTADNRLVVHHDYSLASTAGVDVLIKAEPLQKLQSYPLSNRFDGKPVFIPQLQDVVPLVEPELQLLNIEIKNDQNCYPGIEKILLETLQTHYPAVLPKTLFSSFDYETLARIRNLYKNARIGLLTRSFDVSAAKALGAESIHLNYTRFTPQMAQDCHANGLKIYLYTVNDLPTAQELERQGADGIFTDRVGDFLAANKK